MAQLDSAERAAFMQRLQQLDATFPAPPQATVKDFINHIDYAVKLIGVEHDRSVTSDSHLPDASPPGLVHAHFSW